jgi:hypothetical protein
VKHVKGAQAVKVWESMRCNVSEMLLMGPSTSPVTSFLRDTARNGLEYAGIL